jgi:hypothetical protein
LESIFTMDHFSRFVKIKEGSFAESAINEGPPTGGLSLFNKVLSRISFKLL